MCAAAISWRIHLWALSTGGATGTGLGLGDPETVPAAHTDLVISAFGEQAGLLGITCALCAVRRADLSQPADRAECARHVLFLPGDRAGADHRAPDSADHRRPAGTDSAFRRRVAVSELWAHVDGREFRAVRDHPFRFQHGRKARSASELRFRHARAAWLWLGVSGYRAGAFRLGSNRKADDILVRAQPGDASRRSAALSNIIRVCLRSARELPKGTIFDRNGIPLATSDRAQIEQHRADYQKLGVALDQTTRSSTRRHYPLGPAMFYLLGDVRSRLKQGATNTAFEESASRIRLQGYDDVAEVEETHDPETGQLRRE